MVAACRQTLTFDLLKLLNTFLDTVINGKYSSRDKEWKKY